MPSWAERFVSGQVWGAKRPRDFLADVESSGCFAADPFHRGFQQHFSPEITNVQSVIFPQLHLETQVQDAVQNRAGAFHTGEQQHGHDERQKYSG